MKYALFFTLFVSTLLIGCAKKKTGEPTTNSTLKTTPKRKIFITNPGNQTDIQPLIQAAVDTAKDGDEINIPEGEFVVHNSIYIAKAVSFKGAGISKTLLYRSDTISDNLYDGYSGWDVILYFNINSNVATNLTVSDIYFKSKTPSTVSGDGLSLAKDIGIKMIKCIDFVITRCRFENFGSSGISIVHDDNIASGLIHKNEFYHNYKGSDGQGYGYGIEVYGSNMEWVKDPKFGTSNFIFIENNTFDYHRHAIAAGGSALYVARHNTITNNIIGASVSTHAIDTHSGRGGTLGTSNYFGTRAVEVYENTITNSTFKNGTTITPGLSASSLIERAILIRAGEAVVYNNTITGYRFGVAVSVDEFPFGTSYPMPYTTGYLSGLAFGASDTGTDNEHGAGDLFSWNNNFTPYEDPKSTSTDFLNYYTEHFTEGRDYHLLVKPNYKAYSYPHPLSTRD